MGLVEEIKASAEDALERGFAIIACTPHEKSPWAQYSPHAWQSASRVPEIALKPWNDGTEANYGVSCGPSNVTVLDADHGLTTEADWLAWKKEHNLPDTFTVLSGRDGELGIHMYFTGAVPTCGFKLGNVTGELKGIGGYVVGPGSVHPSGKKYTILHDVPIVPLPDGLVELAKNKQKGHLDFVPGKGDLIPAGNRWAHMQSKAGMFKNAGLDEEGIYLALKNFCANNCEDGENYPDDKIRNLAEWASSDKCDAESSGLVTIGSPDPDGDSTIPECPLDVIEGDYVGDLSGLLTKGTFIPPSFARGSLKVMIGAMADGYIGFPGEPDLPMRHWNALISSRPEAGKSVIWKRLIEYSGMHAVLKKNAVEFPPSGFFSSGEHAIRTLAENDNAAHIAFFDEMKDLFDKGASTGSTLFSKLLPLYEGKSAGVGSIGSGKAECKNVSLNMSGGFTREGFDRSVSGKGAGGNGFLSRMVMEFSNGINYLGDWDELEPEPINACVQKIAESIQWLRDYVGGNEGKPYIPPEDADALEVRKAFQKWLSEEKTRIQQKYPDSSYASRLESHFKRDLLVRVLNTPERRITKKLVMKSVRWAQHQLMLREVLWPVDSGSSVEKFEKRIIHAIDSWGPLTKSGVQKFSNAGKGEGGYDSWNRAWMNLLKADLVVLMGTKSDKGKEKFGFGNGIWDKKKKKWISG